MFKKYIHLFIGFYTLCITTGVFGESVREQMLPSGDGVVTSKLAEGTGDNPGEAQLDSIFLWIRDSIDTLLPILAVGVFLFTGIRIAIARGNAEEFKKAFMQMIYGVVGIFVVGFAWVAVKLVAGLNI